jgi:hypothetical protein
MYQPGLRRSSRSLLRALTPLLPDTNRPPSRTAWAATCLRLRTGFRLSGYLGDPAAGSFRAVSPPLGIRRFKELRDPWTCVRADRRLAAAGQFELEVQAWLPFAS